MVPRFPRQELDVAQSRLPPPYDRHRRELALAFALDTTTTVLATEKVRVVLVVTDDEQAADPLGGSGPSWLDTFAPAFGTASAARHRRRVSRT